jgi:alkylation response protein AidB-like acyl-CoA dehydrogenase
VDFDYSDDQHLLMTAFESLLERFRAPPPGQHGYVAYSGELQAELAASGFLEITGQPGFGLLEAAMMTEAAAHCPVSVELAASAMLGAALGLAAPVAVAWGVGRPVRFLPVARTVVVIEDGRVTAGTPCADIARPVTGVAAYPIAVLSALPHDARQLSGTEAATVRRRALIGVAAEAAGLMRGAVGHTVQYVRERRQFGQPLGNFQAIQHRLAEDAQLVRACRWLAFRAAYADDAKEAAVALLYAQEAMRKVINDCHQFSGAMGLTLEFPLHLWTYRLKVLQGEAGGRGAQAGSVADQLWPLADAA